MQTFLPFADFVETAKCLDYKRLGKQRVEAYQILRVLLGIGKRNKNGNLAWENHPAVKMWKGYESALYLYTIVICSEWKKRGYRDSIIPKINEIIHLTSEELPTISMPPWLNNADIMASHRSNLLRKNKEYYSQFGWTEPNNLPYVWPV